MHAHLVKAGVRGVHADLKSRPPLATRKSPLIAGLLGLCLGALGLALYLRTWRDTWLPFAACLLLPVLVPGAGFLVAVVFCGIYGALRVHYSNEKLDAVEWASARPEIVLAPLLHAPEPARPIVEIEPAPIPVAPPAAAPMPEAEGEPPSPPVPSAPRKRGRPKGPRKLAA